MSDTQKDYKLRTRYGITLEQYKNMLKLQGNKCAICKKPLSKEKKSFCVDHNHKDGFIRGLLCNYCNSKLMKYIRDNKKKVIGLIHYLISALKDDKKWV